MRGAWLLLGLLLACQAPPAPLPEVAVGGWGGPPRGSESCSDAGLCLLNPWPDLSMMSVVWVGALDNVWVAGEQGQVAHYDGHRWARIQVGTTEGFTLGTGHGADFWAASENQVFHFKDGALQRQVWQGQEKPSRLDDILDLWSGAAGQVWLLVRDGGVWRFDGSGWIQVVEPLSLDVEQPRPRRLWGSGPEDLWAIGRGRIYRQQGSAFSVALTLQIEKELCDIDGSGPSDIWVLPCEHSQLLHYDGVSWSTVAIGIAGGFEGLRVQGRSVWVYGSTVAHFDGTSWTELPVSNPVRSLHGIGGELLLVERAGDLLWAGGGLVAPVSRDLTGRRESLTGIWGSGPRDIWITGGGGTLYHFDGEHFARIQSGASSLAAVWGSAADDVWAVGAELLHFDGRSWTRMSMPSAATAVWGSGRDDVWVAGLDLLHYDGRGWSRILPGVLGTVAQVGGGRRGSVWVVNHIGRLWRLEEGVARLMLDITGRFGGSGTGLFTGLWGGFEDIYVMHREGVLFWYKEGQGWREELTPYGGAPIFGVRDLRGPGSVDLWAGGPKRILRRGENGWRVEGTEPGWVHAIWGSREAGLWAVGSGGRIWHRPPPL